jgi:hypothetical protein
MRHAVEKQNQGTHTVSFNIDSRRDRIDAEAEVVASVLYDKFTAQDAEVTEEAILKETV